MVCRTPNKWHIVYDIPDDIKSDHCMLYALFIFRYRVILRYVAVILHAGYLLRLTLRQTRFRDLLWGNLTGYRITLRHVGHDVVADIVCSQCFFGTFSFHFQCNFSLAYAINSQLLHYIVPTREFIVEFHTTCTHLFHTPNFSFQNKAPHCTENFPSIRA